MLDDPPENGVWPFRDGNFLLDIDEFGAVQVREREVHVSGADIHAEHRVSGAVEGELP